MEFENLSFVDAVRHLVRIFLGKEPKLRRVPKHVQREIRCQRTRSNESRWKTRKVYPETLGKDDADEGNIVQDVDTGDEQCSQVSVQVQPY